VKKYFFDPQNSWQYGIRENTNGLLCQYLPKGTDISVYSQNELDAIADGRPRTTHAVHSPIEVFGTPLSSASQPPKFPDTKPAAAFRPRNRPMPLRDVIDED
jgi:IS30 family transposase